MGIEGAELTRLRRRLTIVDQVIELLEEYSSLVAGHHGILPTTSSSQRVMEGRNATANGEIRVDRPKGLSGTR